MATLDLGFSKPLVVCALALTLSATAAFADEIPRFTGAGTVTQSVNGDLGAILDIGGGVTLTLPKGIPVGRSRLVTFKKAAKAPAAAQVQKGFTPLGTAVEFSIPISAGSAPIVFAVPLKADPRKGKGKLVLAMEVGTLCNEQNKATKGKNGLCSGWEIVDAEYESAAQQLVARLQSTGGLRLVFGLVSE
ncbi:MAG: hypothetical protein ABW321_33265 [Polyangiales bacterium]